MYKRSYGQGDLKKSAVTFRNGPFSNAKCASAFHPRPTRNSHCISRLNMRLLIHERIDTRSNFCCCNRPIFNPSACRVVALFVKKSVKYRQLVARHPHRPKRCASNFSQYLEVYCRAEYRSPSRKELDALKTA